MFPQGLVANKYDYSSHPTISCLKLKVNMDEIEKYYKCVYEITSIIPVIYDKVTEYLDELFRLFTCNTSENHGVIQKDIDFTNNDSLQTIIIMSLITRK